MAKIDNIHKEIERYLSDSMTAQEAHAFELKCEQDPFLSDMVDGLRAQKANAADLNELQNTFQNKFLNSRSGFSAKSKWIIGVNLVFILALIIFMPIYLSQQEQPHPIASNEIEKEVVQDTITQNTTTVNAEQIINEQKEIDKTKAIQPNESKDKIDPKPKPEKVQLIEPLEKLPKQTIQLPEIILEKELVKKRVNIKYFYNLKVMSYDDIRRKNIVMVDDDDLSGIPASQESKTSYTSGPLDEKVAVSYNSYLEKVMEHFKRNRFRNCAKQCDEILRQYPNDVNAQFYSAMSLMNIKAYEEAIPYFQNVINSPFDVFYEESLFYYGVTLQYIDKEKSREILNAVINGGGFYKKRAEAILKK